MSAVCLSELSPGEQGRICGYRKGDKVYRQRLLAMGLTPNTLFELVRRAPLGDPIQIRVRNYSLSLRKDEASILLIEREV
ncbi:MAG: ferrous iron transport protein A [Coxiellaceae bacterium]|nr:ferrous iron transport protein A [Coxiellaceae bacterium]